MWTKLLTSRRLVLVRKGRLVTLEKLQALVLLLWNSWICSACLLLLTLLFASWTRAPWKLLPANTLTERSTAILLLTLTESSRRLIMLPL